MVTQTETISIPSKADLLADFIHSASETFQAMEAEFGFNGIVEHFLGVNKPMDFNEDAVMQQIKRHVNVSHAWQELSRLYDFAVDGLAESDDISHIVTNAAEILDLIAHSQYPLHSAWKRLVWQGDGRVALEEGESFELDKLAYLADVDIRTVRNAISSGALTLTKVMGIDLVSNESAHKWLLGRRGFKPTVYTNRSSVELANVSKPSNFAIFLTQQRNRIIDDGGVLSSQNSALTQAVISDLESGLFNLSLSMVNPIADYYQLGRKSFLECVMRTFFFEQFQMLRELIGNHQ